MAASSHPDWRGISAPKIGRTAHYTPSRVVRSMVACPACSTENPSGARFCMGCGAPGVGQALAREERRTVTVLFADLADFTSRSESLDPEDVRAFLLPYYDVLNSEVARHGGHVDRFLGDGIMALFGAPIAHEDDPERAVRAALRILERIPALGLDLHARIGINTGPVLFAVATRQQEDSVTGDTVNTAARLQALAPVGGVVVGESTHAATRSMFEYAALEPVLVKGKAKPVAAYRAMAPRARLGVDFTRSHGPRYIGREADLALLRSLFDKTIAASTVQLVAVVGEPGIGKSRIVGELLAYAQSQTPAVTWHQGRCLPYGDGITYWALGEIVKAQAGILRPTTPRRPPSKLATPFRRAPIPTGSGAAAAARRRRRVAARRVARRAFAAWRTFIETVARADTGTVLVLEDIHWPTRRCSRSSRTLLTGPRRACRFLVVATTRPELFDAGPDVRRRTRFPRWTGSTSRGLPTRDRRATRRGLLGASRAAGPTGPDPRARSGNPLYAEEFVRLLRDRGHLVETDGMVSLAPEAVLPLPDSIEALIAARLDTLPPAAQGDARRRLGGRQGLLDGGGRRDGRTRGPRGHRGDARACAQELVRPARPISMAGEAEDAFWHALTRDVAYAQLPRASRRHAMSPPHDGSRRRPAGGSRTSPRSSPTTTRRRSSSHEPVASRSGRPSSRNPPSATSPWPARRR